MITFKTQGVCSSQIQIEVENGIIKKLNFIGGCPGNLTAISKLVEGMPVEQVINKCKGNRCGNRPTSCADQLAIALENLGNR
ncbi:TIGR03905 family TSCPD domain-containing protein [Acetonema longum]|uniref:ribonucleoside-diphosphate reductase n=1 Tax=Acetonema longum DSM 6540 TaxID=1009370 RepID=F7NEL5_9FIRM|nr:TIGR03905 family TSCPD domain-containing protein [Acetonema longum]EGO65426.1 hypothetical protein ALO_02391 [Acetonema longum DSM 6540]